MKLLANRDFLRLWAGETVSVFGSQITLLALPLAAVLTLHAGSFQMGVLSAAGMLPWLLFALPAGVWTDRRPRRRRILIAADLGRAAILLTVPVASALRRALVRAARDRRLRRRDADPLLRPGLGLVPADDRPARAARRREQQADDEHLGSADRGAELRGRARRRRDGAVRDPRRRRLVPRLRRVPRAGSGRPSRSAPIEAARPWRHDLARRPALRRPRRAAAIDRRQRGDAELLRRRSSSRSSSSTPRRSSG